ncbi:MAG: DMT family transporter [Ruminococcus sp.]|nr:DMT family transporter [Ruminococcus sp.]
MRKNRILSVSALLLAAMIWGVAFVAQDKASETLGTFTINASRSLIASVVLIPLALVLRKKQNKSFFEKTKDDRHSLIKAGLLCGFFLCIAVNLQQFAISMYPESAAVSGRAGFITALYIIFVPIFGLFLKKKPSLMIILAVVLATVGLYFLCLSGGIDALYTGDIVMTLCGMSFAVQILCVDHYIDRVDPIKLSSLQFFVCGVLSAILMFVFEGLDMRALLDSWGPILYLAVVSSGGGYTLQIIGQKYSDSPTVSSILMSMESVFAALGGAIIAGEQLKGREILGCVIMFIAIIIAQIPKREKRE